MSTPVMVTSSPVAVSSAQATTYSGPCSPFRTRLLAGWPSTTAAGRFVLMLPLLSITPATNISARREISPEPQRPRGFSSPMTRYVTS